MSFTKAAQKNKAEGFEEYIEELIIYKNTCKLFSKLRKRSQYSENPLERLRYFEGKELYSKACKKYQKARARYEQSLAIQRLKERGVDLNAVKLAELVGVSIDSSLNGLIKESKEIAQTQEIAKSITQEEFDAITAQLASDEMS
jgi:hypothetical protein